MAHSLKKSYLNLNIVAQGQFANCEVNTLAN